MPASEPVARWAETGAPRMDVFFDLDGTLSDPLEGIARSLNYALGRLGRAPVEVQALRRFVGPPLEPTFRELLRSDDQALISRAVAYYRERYVAVGYRENRVYRGVPEMLEQISRRHRLHLATCKRRDIAVAVLGHFGLETYFTSVNGCGLGTTKAALIAELVSAHRVEPARSRMVGDRGADVEAARCSGIDTIVAGWGFGTPAEIAAARPLAVAAGPAQVQRHLRCRATAK